MPNLPNKFSEWPSDADTLAPDKVVEMYGNGFAGVIDDKEQKEAFKEDIRVAGGWATGDEAASAFGLFGNGKGKLSLPWLATWKVWPECWPGPGQTTGDCVSWGTKNACLVTLGAEIVSGKPDEVTGRIEGPPDVPAEGINQGVLSTEVIYGHRGHSGQGADCARLARYVVSVGGLMVRKNYEEIGLDLTRYNSSIGARWGGRGTPEEVNKIAKEHPVRTATELSGQEQVRDFLASGYGVNTCSGLGFSSTRNEDGFSEQRGSWSHSQAIIGYDDREDTIKKYGEPLALWLNSWGKWNSGPRRVRGTDIDIPDGAYWARASLFRRCYLVAFSSTQGWPSKQLPDYEPAGF